VSRLSLLRSLPSLPEYLWALDLHGLALQWFENDFNVQTCVEQCHRTHDDIGDDNDDDDQLPLLINDGRKSIANISALALCGIVDDIGVLVFPDIAVDCNIGIFLLLVC
jgi:hypothetical protein